MSDIRPIQPVDERNLRIRFSISTSPFADVLLASTELGICSASLSTPFLPEDEALSRLKARFPKAILEPGRTDWMQAFEAIWEHQQSELRFHLKGTPFQLEVWNALLDIPLGATTTYGTLAARIGRPNACRAVGSAVGDNPIFYAIPCHRVLPAGGGTGNYYWGPELKKQLLEWEKEAR